jgi:hypothetical protein
LIANFGHSVHSIGIYQDRLQVGNEIYTIYRCVLRNNHVLNNSIAIINLRLWSCTMILAPSLRVLPPTSDSLGAQVVPYGPDLLPLCFNASWGSGEHEG